MRDPVWLTYFRLHHRHAARYRAGRVFLAGDAAHVHSPAGAQRMNTGIQEAWNLGWKLALVARGIADEALLDTYEAERRPIGRFVLRFTDRAATIATSESRILRLLRTQLAPRLAPVVLRSSRARAYGFRTLAQLRIHYRHSPAVPRRRAGPQARAKGRRPSPRRPHRARRGSRLVTGSCRHAELSPPPLRTHRRLGPRAPRRLAEAPRRPPRGAPAGPRRPGALHDLDGRTFARLGVDDAAQYLVRPDGHIGYRSGSSELGGVDRYLARWFPGAGLDSDRSSRYAPATSHD